MRNYAYAGSIFFVWISFLLCTCEQPTDPYSINQAKVSLILKSSSGQVNESTIYDTVGNTVRYRRNRGDVGMVFVRPSDKTSFESIYPDRFGNVLCPFGERGLRRWPVEFRGCGNRQDAFHSSDINLPFESASYLPELIDNPYEDWRIARNQRQLGMVHESFVCFACCIGAYRDLDRVSGFNNDLLCPCRRGL